MPDNLVTFNLPRALATEAAALFRTDRLTHERKGLRKRFRPGLTGQDLEGFSLQGRALQLGQLPTRFLEPQEAEETKDHDPAIPQDQENIDEAWLAFAERLIRNLPSCAQSDARLRRKLGEYRESGVIPDWVTTDMGRNSKPYIRRGYEAIRQAAYRQMLERDCPRLARYFVPMLPFALSESDVFVVMPYLSTFATFDTLFLGTTGVTSLTDETVNPREARRLFRFVLAELVKIIRLGCSTTAHNLTEQSRIVARMQERFSTDYRVSLVIGDKALEEARRDVMGVLQTHLMPLWERTKHFGCEFGHGDLNATNVLVALRRDAEGNIVETCVRLIDPNPRGLPKHGLWELGRLLHWIELGTVLRASRRLQRALFSVEFRGEEEGYHFLDQPPLLRLNEPERTSFSQSYQLLLSCLFEVLPEISETHYRDMISLGVGLYHLVAAKYWPRNHDRACAFWAGVNEFRTHSGSHRSDPGNGLWKDRRMRGRH